MRLGLIVGLFAFGLVACVGTRGDNIQLKQGSEEQMSGQVFSNFENFVFITCKPGMPVCDLASQTEYYSIKCEPEVCTNLLAYIKTHEKTPDQAVNLKVVLTGQRDLTKSESQYLGDPGQTVHIKRIDRFELLGN
ncbi:hypothetical protein PQU92_12015 [Asticcacaulis sp. BYS171W]|uniref:Lipoprotein n=1 Tax=Asticcacaulis aquaticus TaxID=2984212 RepID=A0ABT5HVZ1_9CAUL|nr:hypothetical protein [Asticcacaulis aquaticus]MDC7684005.1 hypothetical protein [Asticcacaulis aquaticus]